MSLKSGKDWMSELQGALVSIVRYMALNRYGAVPDIADRVSDALAALVEGSSRFEPQPDKDGVGYYLDYVLSYVAGALRNGAQTAKSWSEEATSFVDLEPEALGIEAIWERTPGSPDEEPEETLFVTKSGKVLSKMELLEMATDEERGPKVARLLGLQIGDPNFAVKVLQALDQVEDQLTHDPRWIEEVPGAEPVVTHDLEDVLIIRNGVQTSITGAEMRQMVEEASQSNAMWSVGEGEEDDPSETDNPWPTWVEADGTRAYHSPYADDNTWPSGVSKQLWKDTVAAWAAIGWADDVLGVLEGTAAEVAPEVKITVSAMEALGEIIADEPDGSARIVARALANRLHANGVVIKHEDDQTSQDALFERLCWAWGVDGTSEWEPVLPTADGTHAGIEAWVKKAVSQRGVWPSQKAAIEAVVLHGASPQEARQAARAAFAACQA